MNERLTIQDLTDLLAAKHSMTKKAVSYTHLTLPTIA